MKILPIQYRANFINNRTSNKQSNQYSQPKVSNDFVVLPQYSGIYFGNSVITKAAIESQSAFRKYARGGHVGCMWCENLMFVQEETDKFLIRSKKLSRNAEVFARVMRHFKDYFSETQLNIISNIEKVGKENPHLSLQGAIKELFPQAEKELIVDQQSVFAQLRALGDKLPEKQQLAFNKLLENSEYRIEGKPYVSAYSAKEFYYQVFKMADLISDSKISKNIKEIANLLNHPTFKELGDKPFPSRLIARMYKETKINPKAEGNYVDPKDKDAPKKVQKLILGKIKELAASVRREDIVELCNITTDKIDKKPVTLQFSNKAFRYKLAEILEGVEDKELLKRIEDISETLPTSINNEHAFIVKHKNRSAETIIFNFLDLSAVSIEHIIPRSKGGANEMFNMGLACKRCNGIHGSDDISGENFPFSLEAGQKYFNQIIEDANAGLFHSEDVIGMVKNYRQTTGRKIDTSKLKYNPEY